MKKHFLALGLAAALLAPQAAGAEGFAINEWSAEGVAMGGARMFAEDDAANVAYNPASITKVKGEVMKSSYTYLSPHGSYKLYDKFDNEIDDPGKNKVHAGWAVGSYYVKQINDKEWFGIGAFPRFAMVSEFERESKAAYNAFFSKLNGVSVTPTYAHKFDKKWSAAVGAEVNYVGLELQKRVNTALLGGGDGTTQIEGESYALGWNAAANYTFDEKNEIGVVYRSRITHSLEADLKGYGVGNGGADVFANAYGVVTLPDSWDIGYNHKFDKKTRVELKATHTNWSTYDALNVYFDRPLVSHPGNLAIGAATSKSESAKNWSNGWRYAIGVEHNLSDKYAVMAGFAYDQSSIPFDGGDFLVPTGDRRTYSLGARYNDKKQTLAVALGWMDVGSLDFKGHASDAYARAHAYDSFTKIASISYQRKF